MFVQKGFVPTSQSIVYANLSTSGSCPKGNWLCSHECQDSPIKIELVALPRWSPTSSESSQSDSEEVETEVEMEESLNDTQRKYTEIGLLFLTLSGSLSKQ